MKIYMLEDYIEEFLGKKVKYTQHDGSIRVGYLVSASLRTGVGRILVGDISCVVALKDIISIENGDKIPT